MAMIVTEAGFAADDWTGPFVPFEAFWTGQELPEEGLAVDFPNDRDAADLVPWLERVELVRIAFATETDVSGFLVGRRLRELGYAGRLRAGGVLVAEQFRMARRAGFDELEITEAIARSRPEAQWRIRSEGSYEQRIATG